MTYYEITQKMKDLSMTPSDWSWLSKYLIETGSAHVYSELVNADTVDMNLGANTVDSVDIKEVQHEEGEVQLGSFQH